MCLFKIYNLPAELNCLEQKKTPEEGVFDKMYNVEVTTIT